jgi:hypothetical protein
MSSPGVDPRTNRNVRTGVQDGAGSDPAATTKDDYAGIDSLGSLLEAIPELRHLVDKAVSESWTASKFQNAIEDSGWWKNHSSTARQVIIQRANDPKSFNQSLNNATNSVTSLADQLGFHVDPATAKAIANSALLSGNDTNQQWLTKQLGRRQDYSGAKNTKGLSGGMAQTVAQLQSLASDYGFTYTPAQLEQRAQQVVMGATTIDTYQNQLKQWAKSAFPPLAKEIDAGTTVKQLADPYVNSMSQLLEIDPGSLSAYTPAIRQAMQGITAPGDKAGVKESMPLWKFEQQVRSDPRWQYTGTRKRRCRRPS